MDTLVFGLIAVNNLYKKQEPIVPEPAEFQPFDLRKLECVNARDNSWLSMGVRKTNCRGRLARSGTIAGSLPQLANMLTIQELQTWKRNTRINIVPDKKTGLPFRRTSN